MKRLLQFAALAAALWCAGFFWFVHLSLGPPASPPPQADGIVALTGGAERVETALRLLAQGRAPLLLVSGIGGGAVLPDLAARAGLDPNRLLPQVTLGRKAATTRGNALETAEWANEKGIRSLLVVTAGYHMPRALTELSRAMPDVTLHPVPVVPPGMQGGALLHPANMRLLAEEYTKFLLVRTGLVHAAQPPPAPALPPHRLS